MTTRFLGSAAAAARTTTAPPAQKGGREARRRSGKPARVDMGCSVVTGPPAKAPAQLWEECLEHSVPTCTLAVVPRNPAVRLPLHGACFSAAHCRARPSRTCPRPHLATSALLPSSWQPPRYAPQQRHPAFTSAAPLLALGGPNCAEALPGGQRRLHGGHQVNTPRTPRFHSPPVRTTDQSEPREGDPRGGCP